MNIFRNLGTKFGERKRMIAGTLAFTGIAVAIFFAGAWAASSGVVTLGPSPALASHATHASPGNAHESSHSCCPMHAGEKGSKMGKHGDKPSGEMKPNMGKHGDKPSSEMKPNMGKHGDRQ